jgi:ubiquinone biosynthesis protein
MPFPFRSRRISGIRHFGVISRILVKHGLGEIGDRLWGRGRGKLKSGLPDAARIRRALEDLGPSFIKLGQLMSTRGDIFPPSTLKSSANCRTKCRRSPSNPSGSWWRANCGSPWMTCSAASIPTAMAAASVAQVHTALLKDGRKVAVKVIRPGIEKRIRKDIQLMYYFAARIEKKFNLGRMLGVVNLVKEFERTISANWTCSPRRATSSAFARVLTISRSCISLKCIGNTRRNRCW